MNTFIHLHSSSRFDRSPAVLEHVATKYNKDADVVTYTEVEAKDRKEAVKAAAEATGFHCVFGSMPELANDQVVSFKKERFKLVHSESFKTSDFQYASKGGKNFPKSAITIAVLEDLSNGKRVAFGVMHLASSVEGELAKKITTRRTVVWFDSFKNGRKHLNRLAKEHKADARFFVADFNINFKKVWARALVKGLSPAYTNGWLHTNVKGGTHGNRIIDATLFRGKAKPSGGAHLYEDDASSDHRPYIEKIRYV